MSGILALRFPLVPLVILLSAALRGEESPPPSEAANVRFAGSVVDSASGTPLVGATVYVVELKRGATTDLRGRFEFAPFPPGRYEVIVRYLGYEELRVRISFTDDINRVFALKPAPIRIPTVHITERRFLADFLDSPQPLTVLTPEEINRHRGQSFGQTLDRVPGVSLLQTGPSIAKPVLRGLHSQRVLLMNAGVLQEGQQWGGEHAPEIDPFTPARIEVVRGAPGVEYGVGAIGGVINVEPRLFPAHEDLGGEVVLNAFANNRQAAGGIQIGGVVPLFPSVRWKAHVGARKAGDASTADYVIGNSGFAQVTGSLLVGLHRDEAGIDAFVSHFETELGIYRGSHFGNLDDLQRALASPRPPVKHRFSYDITPPSQTISHQLWSLRPYVQLRGLGRLEVQYGWQQNRRKEFDPHRSSGGGPAASTRAAFDLELTTYTLDLKFRHNPIGNVFGSVGLSGLRQGNVNGGYSLLIPNYRLFSGGIFVVENWVGERTTASLGGRYDHRWMKVYLSERPEVRETTHRFDGVTLSGSVQYRLAASLTVGLNAGAAWRPPNVNELYSDGVHHGTAQYEIGDPALREERSREIEVILKHHGDRVRAEIALFEKRIRNFLFLLPGPQPTLTLRGIYPTFLYRQADAQLRGIDGSIEVHPLPALTFGISASVVRGDNLSVGQPLFQIPADRVNPFVRVTPGDAGPVKNAFVEVGLLVVAKQDRVPAGVDYKEPPPGYILTSLEAGGEMMVLGTPLSLSLSVRNLFNVAYRDYLSRFRYFIDEPGRDVVFRLQIPFGEHAEARKHQ